MSVSTIVTIIISVIPFVALALRSRKINLNRKQRGHQFIMPFLALLYCIPMMLLINQIATMLVGVLRMLGVLIGFIPIIGSPVSAVINELYSILHLGYGIQIFCNTVLMAGFCILKRIALPVIKKWWSKWRSLYNCTSAFFYKEHGEGCILRQKYAQMRDMFRVMYYVAIVLDAITMILAFVFSDSMAFAFPTYPVFGIILFGEIVFFLDGKSQDEWPEGTDDSIDSEDTEINCDELIKKMKEVFKDRVNLADHIPEPITEKIIHNWAEEYGDGDSVEEILGAYFSNLQNRGEKIYPDYVKATDKLMHHNSVLIYNPFYGDLTSYLHLPIFHELLNNHSVLFICGRTMNEDAIKKWIQDSMEEVTCLPKLWKIEELSIHTVGDQMPDVGILGFRKLYDLENMRINEGFFKRTTLIIILEPSNLLGTGQVGLRSILQFCEEENKKITYCALDRNADGLVDALSHVIRQSITEVVASPVPQSQYCRIFWQAEGPGIQNRILPRISHYLGLGGEVATLALHEGVQNIHWFSGSKMPLLDLRWNIYQYYSPICQYIHLAKEQSQLDNCFHFHEDLWQAKVMKNAFLLAEDEFCNLFEMSRTFASRIQKKGTVNILSESYMLRDYMISNSELFSNDPKAIPSIVPDYARTERNFVLRTIMLMSVKPLDEKELSRELALHGNDTFKPYERLITLIKRHTGLNDITIRTQRDDIWIGGRICSRFSYSVDSEFVENAFHSALKPAYYVIEDEETEKFLMGNRLMGHIEQALLPGQFFCYDGKYYQVRTISAQNGIIVRRAADHLDGRYYYRQLRKYVVKIVEPLDDAKNLRGIKLQNYFSDIDVVTDGYLIMNAGNNLSRSSLVRLDTPVHRAIIHKEILKAEMENASAEVCFTLCVILNELFRTIYPNEVCYLVAVPNMVPERIKTHEDYENKIRSLVPDAIIENTEGNSIYFIEDSTLDLGLLVSVERNFQRIMEIAADYLDWYLDPKRKHIWEEDEEDDEKKDVNSNIINANNMEESAEEGPEIDGEEEELLGENHIKIDAVKKMEYLTYGYENNPEWLALEDTLRYLNERQFNDSNLQHTRKIRSEFDDGSDYDPNQPGQHYCDFCGCLLQKGQYVVLKDGRERCPECSKDAVKTRKQFRQVYLETVREMEEIFDIKLDYKIKVKMANAKKVNEGFKEYEPSPRMDARILGYASGGECIMVENGAPKWKMKSTLVHELTHIWQHHNWTAEILNKYGEDERVTMTMEGMAVWTEIQYLMSMGEKERAIRYKRNRDIDTSVYGVGMKKFLKKYPVKERKTVDKKHTPFGKFPKIRKSIV